MENDRPFWAKTMINIATGITFGGLIIIVVLMFYLVIKTIWNWTL